MPSIQIQEPEVKERKYDTGEYVIQFTCCICKKIQEPITISDQQMYRFQTGRDYIQNIFPELTPQQRELFMTRICCL